MGMFLAVAISSGFVPKARWASASLVPHAGSEPAAAGVGRESPLERGNAVAFCSRVVTVTTLPQHTEHVSLPRRHRHLHTSQI